MWPMAAIRVRSWISTGRMVPNLLPRMSIFTEADLRRVTNPCLPIARISTRVTCVAAKQAQTTLDPRAIRSIIGGMTWTLPAFQKLYRLKPEEYDLTENAARLDALSMLDWVDKNSPPFFLWNQTADYPLTKDLDINRGIHHPAFGRALKSRLDAVGIECILRGCEDHPSLEGTELDKSFLAEAGDFILRQFRQVSPVY